MRKLHVLAFVTTLVAMAFPAIGRDYVVAMPDAMAEGQLKATYEAVQSLVRSIASPGETVFVVRGSTMETVATFHIPEGAEGENENRRRRRLADAMSDFGQFIKTLLSPSSGTGHGDQIHFPALMTAISTELLGGSRVTDRNVCVLVAGSALLRDDREPQFNMQDGRYPSDGLIIASQTESIYGTADRQGNMAGISVHFLATDDDWQSDVYELRVQRVWYLFVRAQGGTLATFTSDTTTALERFVNCDIKPTRQFEYDSSRNQEAMLSIERSADPVASVADVPVESAPVPTDEGPCSTTANDDWLCNATITATDSAPSVDHGSFKIGIRWGDGGRCASSDIDLYVRSDRNSPYLFFHNVETPEGRYFKDFRSAPSAENGLEFVELTQAVPLASLDAWINYYEGQCEGGVDGTVRAYFNGATYEMPFSLSAERGNRGDRMKEGKYWVHIDPKRLFNLD